MNVRIHQFGRHAIVILAGVAQPAHARITPGSATVGPEICIVAQRWNPGALVGQEGDDVRPDKWREVAPPARGKGLAVADAKIVPYQPAARRGHLAESEPMVLVQVIAEQFLLS